MPFCPVEGGVGGARDVGGWPTGTGSAAHRGADHRVLRSRADDRRSCAAVFDGWGAGPNLAAYSRNGP